MNRFIPLILLAPEGVDWGLIMNSTREGVADIVAKPINHTKLIHSIKKVLHDAKERNLCNNSCKDLQCNIPLSSSSIIGSSDKIEKIRKIINKLANSESRVLITGENGTGKELVAENIHLNSIRRDAPIIKVNCAAIPNELIESTLFGHEKGAFTGADFKHIGYFEQANGGTLFLDEIGDMCLSAQTKVLRALQNSEITRVGGKSTIKIDVRIIAATNKNLDVEMTCGRFREDLYHRLNVIPIHISPLRERPEDIPELVNTFINKICRSLNIEVRDITSSALNMLYSREWKGNIRELQNVLERLLVLSDGVITADAVEEYC